MNKGLLGCLSSDLSHVTGELRIAAIVLELARASARLSRTATYLEAYVAFRLDAWTTGRSRPHSLQVQETNGLNIAVVVCEMAFPSA